MATELRPLRAFSIDKARNLFRSAQVALSDARAPAQYVSAARRFDAAYDCGLQCALVLLECSKFAVQAQNHHQVAFDFLFIPSLSKYSPLSPVAGPPGSCYTKLPIRSATDSRY